MKSSSELTINFKPQIIPAMAFIVTEKARFKVVHGGRGAGRSWGFADATLYRIIANWNSPQTILCAREYQNSIRDSVHKLICDRISYYGLDKWFKITNAEITCTNGSVYAFKGLHHNSSEIKSFEGADVCWVEEAHNVSAESWRDLTPTIRKPDSEIWVSFNTKYGDTYDMFVARGRDDAIVKHLTYEDNPHFPEVLRKEMEHDKAFDNAKYNYVWLGIPDGYQGRVYPMYDEKVHYIDFPLDMLKDCNCYMAIDPHHSHYPAIKWYAVTPTGCCVVYNEWPKFEDLGMFYDEARFSRRFDLTLKDLANIIESNDLSLQYGAKILSRIPDPRFDKAFPEFVQGLQACGISGWVRPEFEKVEVQREAIKRAMSYNPALPMCGVNTPIWYVRKGLKNTNRAYVRHCFDEKKDCESDDYKDFIDCDRYFKSVLGEIVYKEMAKSTWQSVPVISYSEITVGHTIMKNTMAMGV